MTATATQAVATSGLPRAIAPATAQEVPSDYTLITVGLKQSLNYPFVVKNSISSAQIFEYLPSVLVGPFGFANSNVTVVQLVPFTSSTVDYIITVAEVYFPSEDISYLQNLILNGSSTLYSNYDETVREFATLIDSSIPLTGLLNQLDESANGSSGSSSGGSQVLANSGSMEYSASQVVDKTGKSQKLKIAGITIGSILGACVYIALMVVGVRLFIVRRRIQLTIAQNSILPTSSNASVDSFQVAYGAGVRLPSSSSFGGSNDGAQMSQVDNYVPRISKPVAAQNSLGWS